MSYELLALATRWFLTRRAEVWRERMIALVVAMSMFSFLPVPPHLHKR